MVVCVEGSGGVLVGLDRNIVGMFVVREKGGWVGEKTDRLVDRFVWSVVRTSCGRLRIGFVRRRARCP